MYLWAGEPVLECCRTSQLRRKATGERAAEDSTSHFKTKGLLPKPDLARHLSPPPPPAADCRLWRWMDVCGLHRQRGHADTACAVHCVTHPQTTWDSRSHCLPYCHPAHGVRQWLVLLHIYTPTHLPFTYIHRYICIYIPRRYEEQSSRRSS